MGGDDEAVGATVVVVVAGGEGDDGGVAGDLPVGAAAAGGQPDERVEPVRHLEERQQPLGGHVTALQVDQLVQEDEAQLGARETVRSAAGQQQPPAPKAT